MADNVLGENMKTQTSAALTRHCPLVFGITVWKCPSMQMHHLWAIVYLIITVQVRETQISYNIGGRTHPQQDIWSFIGCVQPTWVLTQYVSSCRIFFCRRDRVLNFFFCCLKSVRISSKPTWHTAQVAWPLKWGQVHRCQAASTKLGLGCHMTVELLNIK